MVITHVSSALFDHMAPSAACHQSEFRVLNHINNLFLPAEDTAFQQKNQTQCCATTKDPGRIISSGLIISTMMGQDI